VTTGDFGLETRVEICVGASYPRGFDKQNPTVERPGWTCSAGIPKRARMTGGT